MAVKPKKEVKKSSVPADVKRYLAELFFLQWTNPTEIRKIKITEFLYCLFLLKMYPEKLCDDLIKSCDHKIDVFDVDEAEKVLTKWERQWDSTNSNFGIDILKKRKNKKEEIGKEECYGFNMVRKSMIGRLAIKTHWYRRAWTKVEPPLKCDMFRCDGKGGRTLTIEDIIADDWKPYFPNSFGGYSLIIENQEEINSCLEKESEN